MARRISKKLLVGLGATLGFSTTAFLGGFGVKTLVEANNKLNQLLNINSVSEANYDTLPDFNLATRDMFIDTNNIKSFHFGNVQKGQSVTPFGWLGTHEGDRTKIVLTGWNGEILWINDDYGNVSPNRSWYNAFDIKYDWNTNLVFVIRSSSPTGIFKVGNKEQFWKTTLDVLDANTGKRLSQIGGATMDDWLWNDVKVRQKLRKLYDINNPSDRLRLRGLYHIDVTSQNGSNNRRALMTYMPDYMQLYDRETGVHSELNQRSLPSLKTVIDDWTILARSWAFEPNSDNTSVGLYTRTFDPRKSKEFKNNGEQWVIENQDRNTKDFSLLANPFYTTSVDNSANILHFIVADLQGNIFHKSIGFNFSSKEVDPKYEKTEKLSGNNGFALNIKAQKWANAKSWASQMINANTRVNHNILNPNQVVFAYPYAASQNQENNFPIFNVAQLTINPNNGLVDSTKSVNYDFGKQIYDAWEQNNNVKTKPFPNANNDNQFTNLHHNYNRLLSVSPFDNTIIYASRPNFDNFLADDSASDDWVGLWIARANSNGQAEYQPLVLPNNANLGGVISNQMISNTSTIYNEGFAFDLDSLNSFGNKDHLNLYFNQSGTGRNDFHQIFPNGKRALFRSSKIGLLDDVLSFKSNGWVSNIVSSSTANLKDYQAIVTENSFANLITSHVDLAKWYPRTWQNLNKAGNLYQEHEQINQTFTNENRALISQWSQVNKNDLFNEKAGVDPYVNWLIGKGKSSSTGNLKSNYDRLVIKQPTVRARNESIPNVLPVWLSYDVNATTINKYKQQYQFDDAKLQKLNWAKKIDINNGSVEFLTSWSKHDKIKSISNSTKNFNVNDSWNDNSHETWFDARQNNSTNQNFFGQISNAANINNQRPLRLMLRIVKPVNPPSWFNQANQEFFKWYPIGSEKLSSETGFDEVLNQFVTWKTSKINLDQNSQSAVGLANLKIEAGLGLNPLMIDSTSGVTNTTLYKFGNTKKIVYLNNTGQKYFYDDQYVGSSTIYDQSATQYNELNQQGFGSQVQQNLAASWVSLPSTNNKIMINADAHNLPDTLVRRLNSPDDPIFKADYVKNSNHQKIEIKPVNDQDWEWFKGHFQKFNQALNLFAKFEYQTRSSSHDQWSDFGKPYWTDQEITDSITKNKALIIETNNQDIIRVRFRLVASPQLSNGLNDFVQYTNFAENDSKFISNGVLITPTQIIFDASWFNNIKLNLANSSGSLADLTKTDIEQFEERILQQSAQFQQNPGLKKRIKFVYSFNKETNLTSEQLTKALKTKLKDYQSDDQGIFTLWNGSDGTLKISSTMILTDPTDPSFVLVKPDGSIINDSADRSADVKSDIKTSVDLSSYFKEIQKHPLKALKGDQSGTFTSFEIPKYQANKPGKGQLFDKTYAEVEKILNAVSVEFQFKEWDANANNGQGDWSNWKPKANISKYNPSNPAIKIGLKIAPNKNIEIKFENDVINDSWEWELKLHLPKLVQADPSIWEAFKNANPFGGNTFDLNIDNVNQAETILKKQLVNFNETLNPGTDFSNLNDQIEVKYRLGKSGQFQSATELKQFLSKQNQDQGSNQISFLINLSGFDQNQPDFELDNQVQTFQELLADNNTIVKKFLHGSKYENELNQINVTGSDKENLEYVYGPNLQKVVDQDPSVGPLRLEWTYDENLDVNENTSGKDPNNQWVQDELPLQVADNIKNIFVRIKNTDSSNIYLYGPDLNLPTAKIKGIINLSKIATIVRVDKAWIKNTLLSKTEVNIDQLNPELFEQWKSEVFKKISINDKELLKKITFKFIYNGEKNLTVETLIAKIKQELQAYDESHLGIIRLWNGLGQDLGNRIQATFTTIQTDSLVKIQDINGSTSEVDLTNDLNTSKVITSVDLTNYVNVLKTKKTKVKPKGTVRPEQISDFTPPAGEDANGFLNLKSYDQIANRLNAVGISIKFSKEIKKPNWQDKAQITEYNPRNNKLFLLFSNVQNNNLKIKIGQEEILAGRDSQNIEIGLPLAVPRQINIDKTSDLAGFTQLMQFSGDTKNISYNEAGASTIIQRILQRNAKEANNDSEYLKAPLKVKFALGNNNQYYALEQDAFKNFLRDFPDDFTSREIRWKFDLEEANSDEWIFSPDTVNDGLEGVLIEDVNSLLKIYINNKNLYEDLQKPSLQGSTSANLKISWAAYNINIDPMSGLLSATETNNANPRGVGLKIEFTYMDNFTGAADENLDSNPFRGWSSQIPTSFNPNVTTKLSVRIRLQDENKYTYDRINQKFIIDLSQIPAVINLDGNWLQKPITTQEIDLENLNQNQFKEYEKLVWQEAQLGSFDQTRVQIAYTFANQEYLNLDDLINAIKQFKTNHANEPGLGILQLWNGQNSGQKIIAKFVKVDKNDSQYELNIANKNEHDLDFSQVITNIDFSGILAWLQTLEIEIKETTNNGISSLIIPNVTAVDPYFGNQSWKAVETALKTFGLVIEYSNNIQSQGPNWGDIASVNQYDPKNPSFKIHFKSDGSTSTNIKLKLSSSEILDGKASNTSNEHIIKIKAKLLVEIDPQLKTNFQTSAIFGGNTKELEITKVFSAQNQFINEIISQNMNNDSRYEKLKDQLEIEYILQKTLPTEQSSWKSLVQLQSFLAQELNDQTTNQIWYRIKLKDTNTFRISSTDEQPVILNAHQLPTDPGLKIQYYINDGQWETKAEKIVISGPTDDLIWNFNQVFQTDLVEKNDRVYLRNDAGQALQVYFTLNEQASYNNPNDLSDSLGDLTTKWVSIKPRQISAGTKHLKIKLVATEGFAYGPANSKPLRAQAHDVAIHVQNVIFVNKNWFNKQFLSQETEIKALTKNVFDTWEEQIYQEIKNQNHINDDATARTVKIKYLLKNKKYSSQELLAEIAKLTSDYGDSATLGILQLWNSQSQQGEQIKAIFDLDQDDQQSYMLKTVGQTGNPDANDFQGLVNTDSIYTLISLTEYIQVLKSEKTTVELKNNGATPGQIQRFNPPGMTGKIGEQFLSGYSYDQIAQHLEAIGLRIKFAKTASSNDQDWLEKSQIQEYDIQTSVLFLSFEIKSSAKNLKVEYQINQILQPGQNMQGSKAIKLPLDVPKYIIINDQEQFWRTIKQDFAFAGNTKDLTFNETKIGEFIKKILLQNAIASSDATYENAPLKIAFQIGNLEFVEIDALKTYLQQQENDLTDRTINFKFLIPDDEAKNWKLQNTEKIYPLLTNQDTAELAKIKIYINDKEIFNDLKDRTELSGTSQNLVWNFFGDLRIDEISGVLSANNRGKGLKVEFTFNETIDANSQTGNDVNTDWVSQMPKSFVINQEKVFLRLAVVDESLYHYDQKNKKIELSLSQIVVILNLESAWLKLIQLSGNTKDLNIDESAVLTKLANVLPKDKPNLVKIQYSINGTQWLVSDDFKSLLKNQAGKKDENHFILKREDLHVRFAFSGTASEQAKFQMNIDGVVIKPDNTNSPTINIINDQAKPPLNTAVQGYIEIDHLKHFIAANFGIEGSNTQPRLKIKQREQMETMMQFYASDQLFDILITGKKNSQGEWDFNQNISLLTTGNQFISDAELIKRGFSLDTNKNVAIKFIRRQSKYDVYQNGILRPDGHILDISANVKITFEIENPFKKQNKTLALWWTEDRNRKQAKYNQGQGGFKIVNGDVDGRVDETNFESALAWLNSANSGLDNKEKSVLEFVYHIYDAQPSAEEIARVGAHENIVDYEGSIWKSLKPILDTNNGNDFTIPLNLKVGQFVSVALRVKKEYASGADVYTLKDNEHSFMKPIIFDKDFAPGRAHGYKIQSSALEIETDSVILENMLNSDQLPLDGYTNIKRLNLKKDHLANFEGVNLKLQLFHEFYKSSNQQGIIITPFDKIKLVKREANNLANNNYFKDGDGNLIRDEQGKPIPILLDEQGKPTRPQSSQQAIEAQFDSYGEGVFGISMPHNDADRNRWGIFKNEAVKVVFSAQLGQGGIDDPDYILDQPKEIDLAKQISPQIKFPLFNQDNIKYEFNQNDFIKENIKFENATNSENQPIDGKSKIKTLIQLTKTTSTQIDKEIIGGKTAEAAVANLKKELQTAFNDKLRFETTYEKSDGGSKVYNDLDLYKFDSLKNNDRIKVRIVSADEDFIWAEPPKPLTIQVSGLTAKAPSRNLLQFLRVEQNGKINGQGSFRVLINDPKKPLSDPNEALDGWKFVIRVWDDQQQIKHKWTADQDQINDLKNGDKIEWKLVDQFNNPVSDAYYNTIAGDHSLNDNGSLELVFNQVNYPEGTLSSKIVKQGIGQYPDNPDAYPENSGFVINDLQEEVKIFPINDVILTKVINQLEPHYVGLNGQGSINFKADYLNNNYYVNADGEVYQKNEMMMQNRLTRTTITNVVEVSLENFLDNITFYTSDPNLTGFQNGFKFVNNETNLNNQLRNGDQIWAQFDPNVRNNEINQGVNIALGTVSGLQEITSDRMSTLWYVLMALGALITLGALSGIIFWIRRHKKINH